MITTISSYRRIPQRCCQKSSPRCTPGVPSTRAPSGPAPSIADSTARFIRQVIDATSVTRIGIAGGDTSSAAALGLGLWGLAYDRTLEPGVTLCRSRSDTPRLDGLELMLKGGQMGTPDLFQLLLRGGY